MLTHVFCDGFTLPMMEGIVDYQKDEATAVSKQDMYGVTKQGQRQQRKTTTGWRLLAKWKDQSETWTHEKGYERTSSSRGGQVCQGSRNSG